MAGAIRAELVLASRIAGLEPPCDTVWVDLNESHQLLGTHCYEPVAVLETPLGADVLAREG